MSNLIAPNGAKVTVAAGRVDNLLRHGFTKPKETAKAPAKKPASSSKSSK